MKKTNEKIKGSIKENISLMSTPLMSILPGQISFFVILSIVPLASILIMVISKLSISYNTITSFINHYIPSGVASVVISFMEQQKAGVVDVLFIITAFYLAAKATHSIIISSTQIYNGKQKDFVRTRIKAIIMLLILIVLVLMVVVFFVFGSKFITYLKEENAMIHPILYWAYMILKWPFTIFMIFVGVKMIYTIAPNIKIPSKSVNKGALFTTAVWVLTTFIYSFYATSIANYTKFYGNLSNLIILMIWIYWLSYVFVFGMTLNQYKLTNKNN